MAKWQSRDCSTMYLLLPRSTLASTSRSCISSRIASATNHCWASDGMCVNISKDLTVCWHMLTSNPPDQNYYSWPWTLITWKHIKNTHLYQSLPACVWQCMVWNVFLPKLLQAKPRSQSTVVSFSPSGTRWWLRCSWKHSLPRSDPMKAKERRKALLEHRYSSLIHLYLFDLIFIQYVIDLFASFKGIWHL